MRAKGGKQSDVENDFMNIRYLTRQGLVLFSFARAISEGR